MADAAEDDVIVHDSPKGDPAPVADQVQDAIPQGDGEEDEVQISFEGEGDAPPPGEGQDSGLVRHLRDQIREKERRLKALEGQQQPQTIEVGEKPTFAGCDFDDEAYERELDAWKERKAKADSAKAEADRAEEARQNAWKQKLTQVEAQKAKLGVKDYDQAADEVRSTLNDQQQALLVQALKDPAKMIYALGKSPAKAADLAKITNPIEFIAELVRLEGKLTVSTTRKAPPPEKIARGSASLAAGTDKHLAGLEKEADRTGDRTKVIAYKRQLKAQGRS